jgi:hypothetical protein
MPVAKRGSVAGSGVLGTVPEPTGALVLMIPFATPSKVFPPARACVIALASPRNTGSDERRFALRADLMRTRIGAVRRRAGALIAGPVETNRIGVTLSATDYSGLRHPAIVDSSLPAVRLISEIKRPRPHLCRCLFA